MVLNKWYLDITSETCTGYFYIIYIKTIFFRFGASFIYFSHRDHRVNSFKFSRVKFLNRKTILLGNSTLSFDSNYTNLEIKHRDIELRGKWKNNSKPVSRTRKPLLNYEDGWGDWKVWCPYCITTIIINTNLFNCSCSGSGYIDFVRYAFPLSKNPIRNIYWGRLHSVDTWLIFFSILTTREKIAYYFDAKTNSENIQVDTELNEKGNIKCFRVYSKIKNVSKTFVLEVEDEIEDQRLLENKSFISYLPEKFKAYLSSCGFDKKYRVSLSHNDKKFNGIMEEVTWNV